MARRAQKSRAAGLVNWRQYTIGHKGMPNIDTSGANLSSLRHPRAGNMLGRLRAAAAAAPLVLTNGNFYTVNDLQPRAAAAVVVDGRITFVGATPDALR